MEGVWSASVELCAGSGSLVRPEREIFECRVAGEARPFPGTEALCPLHRESLSRPADDGLLVASALGAGRYGRFPAVRDGLPSVERISLLRA